MLKSKTMNNLFWIEVMFYGKLFIIIIIIIIIIRKNSGKPKTVHTDRCQNISFHWSNRYKLQYKIDSLGI